MLVAFNQSKSLCGINCERQGNYLKVEFLAIGENLSPRARISLVEAVGDEDNLIENLIVDVPKEYQDRDTPGYAIDVWLKIAEG